MRSGNLLNLYMRVSVFGFMLFFGPLLNVFAQHDGEIIEDPKKEKAYHPKVDQTKLKQSTFENSDYAPKHQKSKTEKSSNPGKSRPTEPEAIENGKEDMSTLSFNLFLYVLDRFKEE